MTNNPDNMVGKPKAGRPGAITATFILFALCLSASAQQQTITGRVVGVKDINLEQIRRGMAWFYRAYAKKPEDAKAYERAEIAAKEEKAGLWRDPSPTPPWDFRRDKTAKASSVKPPATAAGGIIGNRNSRIYHLPNCPDCNKVSERNRVPFKTEAEAQGAGYRKARNCP